MIISFPGLLLSVWCICIIIIITLFSRVLLSYNISFSIFIFSSIFCNLIYWRFKGEHKGGYNPPPIAANFKGVEGGGINFGWFQPPPPQSCIQPCYGYLVSENKALMVLYKLYGRKKVNNYMYRVSKKKVFSYMT